MLKVSQVAIVLWMISPIVSEAEAKVQSQEFNCSGQVSSYKLRLGEVNVEPAELTVCEKSGTGCGDVIKLDEDTDEETGTRQFYGSNKSNEEYWLEFVETQFTGSPVEYWLSVEKDGVEIDHQIDCKLK